VTDPEDGAIDCGRVAVTFVLGHDTHGHPISSTTGCSGVFQTPADGADHAGGYLYGAISASYTDTGANGQPALTSIDQIVLQTWRQQAELAAASQGVEPTLTTDTGGGQHLTGLDPGDWISINPVNLGGVGALTFRVSGGSAATAGTPRAAVELRLDAPDGPLVSTATINATAGNNAWTSQVVPVSYPAGSHQLYLVFRSVPGGPTTGLFNLNWVEFGNSA
jgi:hypothetical protein